MERITMCNRTTYAKALVTAAGALAIALFTVGMGVNSSWAGDVPAGGKCTQNSDCTAGYACQGINEKICTKI
jgi:hypothetical protein